MKPYTETISAGSLKRKQGNSKGLLIWGACLFAVTLLLSGCAAGPNPLVNTFDDQGYVAGFFMGLWHGIIFPFVFLASLFVNGISVYEVHNSGGWYDLGYLLGLLMIFEGGGRAVDRNGGGDAEEDED